MRINHSIAFLFSIAFSLCGFSFADGQNLVRNPSFESHTNCPPNLGYIMYVDDWVKPINHIGSSDYFHTCAYGTVVYVENNFLGGEWPATGDAYMGIVLKEQHGSFPSYREYIQNHLLTPLVAGQTYTVSLKCSLSDTSWGFPGVTTDALNMYLSANPVSAPAVFQYSEPIFSVTPQFSSLVTIDTSSWTSVSFNYTATGGEEYLLIGNFKDDNNTFASADVHRIYGFIDDVSVRAADIEISGNNPVCPGQSITLTASQSLTYAWANANNPNVILSTSPSITISPTQNTTYYVYGNEDTAIVNVQMKPLPNVHLGNDTVACSTENLLLIAYHGGAFQQGTDYLWSNGNTTPFLTPTQSGTFWVQGTLDGCIAYDTINVVINPNPIINLGADRSICSYESITLDAGNSNVNYIWQDSSTASTFIISESGTYFVTASIGNCTTSDTVHISDAPMPNVNLGTDVSVCSGTSVMLTADNSNDAYLWNTGSVSSTLSPTSSGLYWVKATLGNCETRDSVSVQFFPLPTVYLGNDTMPCKGTTIVLDATQANVTYNWQDDSNLATHSVTESGLYRVQITDANQCKNSDSIQVIFVTMPTLNFYDSTLCEGKEWKLDATTLGGSYVWQNQSTEATFLIENEGTYWTNVNNACGTVSDTATIKYERCDCYFFIPNTLTADDNNVNETFHIVPKNNCDLLQYNVSIYNRWGNLIFQSANVETDWNPENLPLGIYEYRIHYQFESSPEKNLFGHINVLK